MIGGQAFFTRENTVLVSRKNSAKKTVVTHGIGNEKHIMLISSGYDTLFRWVGTAQTGCRYVGGWFGTRLGDGARYTFARAAAPVHR